MAGFVLSGAAGITAALVATVLPGGFEAVTRQATGRPWSAVTSRYVEAVAPAIGDPARSQR
jgi:hypothetical protein